MKAKQGDLKQEEISNKDNLRAMNSELSAKNIFIFDKNKCVGCGACVVACINENGFQSPERWRNIYNSNTTHFPGLPLFHLSLACNHCDDAPCMKNCPALAYARDEITGAIIHDAEKCIGCKYCTWACPYDAPKYNQNKGVIEKCTFCNHRIVENEKPVCAHLCPTGALDFNNVEFAREEILQSSLTDINIGARLKTIELRNPKGPEIDTSLFKDVPLNVETKQTSKISALKEWPLVIFTLLTSGLVAVLSVSNSITRAIDGLYLIFVGLLAAMLSLLHLGKKLRAWRSIVNQKNSWLSREILAFSLLLLLIILGYSGLNIHPVIFIVVGFILLYAIDKLYELAMWKWPLKLHSAQTLLISTSLILLLSQKPLLFLVFAILRIALYFARVILMKKKFHPIRIIRILLLLFTVFGLYYSLDILVLIGMFTIGEIVDRIEFYSELATPESNDIIASV